MGLWTIQPMAENGKLENKHTGLLIVAECLLWQDLWDS